MNNSATLIIPVWNEAESIKAVLDEIAKISVFNHLNLLIINDGSTDNSKQIIENWQSNYSNCRLISIKHCDKDMALWYGTAETTTEWIIVMDGDGQYYSGDLEKIFDFTIGQNADAGWGIRTNRNDTFFRLASSIVGKWIKKILLGNIVVKDTGCGLFIVRTKFLKQIITFCPNPYGQLHCHFPELINGLKGKVIEMQIKHRSRLGGDAKFGMINRLLPGFFSLCQTRYLLHKFNNKIIGFEDK